MAYAVVTGASKGIGRGITLSLARGGFDIVAVARSVPPLERLRVDVQAFKRKYSYISCDLADPAATNHLSEQLLAEHDDIEVLINNAGGGIGARPMVEIEDDEWRRILRLNVIAPYLLTKVIGQAMARRGHGRIINISSGAAKYRVATEVTSAAYVAAKGAMHGLTRQSAKLLAPYGVTVNAILPGDVLTEAGTQVFEALSLEDRTHLLARVPRGKLTTPEEIGAIVLALCTENSGAVVGVSLDINGGAWML